MAPANPGPAADRVSSPRRSEGLAAGPGCRSAGGPDPASLDLVGVARGLAADVLIRTDLRGLGERSWVLLDVTDRYEAWAIGWPPGSGIELHDHGASGGVVAVAEGTLTETVVRAGRRGTVVIATHRIASGAHRAFGPGHLHDLSNDAHGDAVSVHVYRPRLSTVRYYELDGRGRLVVVRSDPIAPAASRALGRREPS